MSAKACLFCDSFEHNARDCPDNPALKARELPQTASIFRQTQTSLPIKASTPMPSPYSVEKLPSPLIPKSVAPVDPPADNKGCPFCNETGHRAGECPQNPARKAQSATEKTTTPGSAPTATLAPFASFEPCLARLPPSAAEFGTASKSPLILSASVPAPRSAQKECAFCSSLEHVSSACPTLEEERKQKADAEAQRVAAAAQRRAAEEADAAQRRAAAEAAAAASAAAGLAAAQRMIQQESDDGLPSRDQAAPSRPKKTAFPVEAAKSSTPAVSVGPAVVLRIGGGKVEIRELHEVIQEAEVSQTKVDSGLELWLPRTAEGDKSELGPLCPNHVSVTGDPGMEFTVVNCKYNVCRGCCLARLGISIDVPPTVDTLIPIISEVPVAECGTLVHDPRSFLVNYCYANMRPQRYDLFFHLRGESCFLVDGDALILEAAAVGTASWRTGAQILHIVYAAERILSSLRERGAVELQIVWFEDVIPLLPAPLRVARAALRDVLATGKLPIVQRMFTSVLDARFTTTLRVLSPSFVMMHDSETDRVPLCRGPKFRALSIYLRAVQTYLINLDVRVVYSCAMSYRGSNVHVFAVIPDANMRLLLTKSAPTLTGFIERLPGAYRVDKLNDAPFGDLLSADAVDGDTRLAAIASATAAAVNANVLPVEHAWAVLAAAMFVRPEVLAVRERCLYLAGDSVTSPPYVPSSDNVNGADGEEADQVAAAKSDTSSGDLDSSSNESDTSDGANSSDPRAAKASAGKVSAHQPRDDFEDDKDEDGDAIESEDGDARVELAHQEALAAPLPEHAQKSCSAASAAVYAICLYLQPLLWQPVTALVESSVLATGEQEVKDAVLAETSALPRVEGATAAYDGRALTPEEIADLLDGRVIARVLELIPYVDPEVGIGLPKKASTALTAAVDWVKSKIQNPDDVLPKFGGEPLDHAILAPGGARAHRPATSRNISKPVELLANSHPLITGLQLTHIANAPPSAREYFEEEAREFLALSANPETGDEWKTTVSLDNAECVSYRPVWLRDNFKHDRELQARQRRMATRATEKYDNIVHRVAEGMLAGIIESKVKFGVQAVRGATLASVSPAAVAVEKVSQANLKASTNARSGGGGGAPKGKQKAKGPVVDQNAKLRASLKELQERYANKVALQEEDLTREGGGPREGRPMEDLAKSAEEHFKEVIPFEAELPAEVVPLRNQLVITAIDWRLKRWQLECRTAEVLERNHLHATQLVQRLQVFVSFFENAKNVDPEVKAKIVSTFAMLGLTELAESVAKRLGDVPSALARLDTNNYRMIVGPQAGNDYGKAVMSTQRFELTYMHHLLQRPLGKPDPRVPFRPDAWQRELIDIVDRRESAVICAPTSSGKTFISFYTIKEVLDSSNTDVVIYVAPTNALARQVNAMVYAYFEPKDYDRQSLRLKVAPDYGLMDFNMNFTGICGLNPVPGDVGAEVKHAANSQILITDPAALERMLLSPLYSDKWARNVKYVIFDEIHCIDEFYGEGAVWERLLIMTRCPFLALSATLGSPEKLQRFVARLQAAHAMSASVEDALLRAKSSRAPPPATPATGRVHLIEHHARWSDIQKFVYIPRPYGNRTPLVTTIAPPRGRPDPSASAVGDGSVNSQLFGAELAPLHPVSQLIPATVCAHWPSDLAMTPFEALQLYDWIVQVVPADNGPKWAQVRELITTLRPETSPLLQPNPVLLDQSRTREWEHGIRRLLRAVCEADEVVAWKVLQLARANLDEKLAQVGLDLKANTSRPLMDSQQYVLDNISDLLVLLAAQDKLPCIVFVMDEYFAEVLARKVADTLEEWETALQEKYDQAQTEKIRARKARRLAQESKTKEKTRSSRSGGGGGEEDGERVDRGARDRGSHRFEKDERPGEDEDIEDIEPDVHADFTFIVEGEGVYATEFEEMLASCNFKNIPQDREQLAVFKRGVGLHTSTQPYLRRAAVEYLLRKRHLKVVIATTTLALGVHMPCRSVVFAGDSPLLTPLQFRQMAGRCGRRGLDPIGNLVLLGIPLSKIHALLTAPVPSLKGHFPADLSTAMRLFSLENDAERDRDDGSRAMRVLRTKALAGAYIGHRLGSLEHRRILELDEKTSGVSRPLLDEFALLFQRVVAQYHFRFHAELLQRYSLITRQGKGGLFHGLASRLLYLYAPSDFLFVALLRTGSLHRLCKQASSKESLEHRLHRVCQELLISMTHVFGLSPIHRGAVADPLRHTQVSYALPIPPPSVQSAICYHFKSVLDAFSGLAVALAKELEQPTTTPLPPKTPEEWCKPLVNPDPQYVERAQASALALDLMMPPEDILPSREAYSTSMETRRQILTAAFPSDELPLSAHRFESAERTVKSDAASAPEGSLARLIFMSNREFVARSPFSAISGHTDLFRSVDDLISSTRPGIFFDAANIPLPSFLDEVVHAQLRAQHPSTVDAVAEPSAVLSSYAVDLYRGVEPQVIVQQLGMTMTDLYQLTQKVRRAFAALRYSFDQLSYKSEEAEDPVVWGVQKLSERLDERVSLIDNRLKKARCVRATAYQPLPIALAVFETYVS